MTSTETPQTERPTRLVGAMMPAPMVQELKDLAWMKRTTVSDLMREATAQLLASQKVSA